MKREEFTKLLDKKQLILDGATGTELQKAGLPSGVCPEKWVLENPEALKQVQRRYAQAGSNCIYSFSFGANRLKLEEFGLQDRVVEMNCQLAELTREAVGEGVLVAGDLAPTGKFVEPFGDLPFEEAVLIYQEQVKGLVEGGVDLFVIETMLDLQEARAALLAVKESCDLVVGVSLTFDESGRTLTGSSPEAAVVALQALGADFIGCNCSTGPEAMLEFIERMKTVAHIPLLVKPNAGLPKLVNGETVFDATPEEFATKTARIVGAGAKLAGGCCGTNPDYIRALAEKIASIDPVKTLPIAGCVVGSAREITGISSDQPIRIIGERINPTGKKQMKAELREGVFTEVRRFAFEQEAAGADLLDVNVGVSGIDEAETMLKAIKLLSTASGAPLCLDSAKPEVIEQALRLYPGRAMINSISGEKEKIKKLLPVAAKYGAAFILLPLDDDGIPETAAARVNVIESVISEAKTYGFTKNDIIVDGLVMTISSDQKAACETLGVIDWCSKNGVGTVLGLSNVSFGLPERKWVNAAFLAMAASNGLTAAIANPSSEVLMAVKMASDVLQCKDDRGRKYVEEFSGRKKTVKKEGENLSPAEAVFDAVLKGKDDQIELLLKNVLDNKVEPSKIVADCLIPAITKVGDLFESKTFFLPQLIMSAETMKQAFDYLEPYLAEAENKKKAKGTIVLATVKGDIHDIGKNIVGLMFKNYGFEVIDLGKDVDEETIVNQAEELRADIVCLSALMTTTMMEMRTVIDLAKRRNLQVKFMVGGAVVDQAFADEIGAVYSKDAYAAVKTAEKLVS